MRKNAKYLLLTLLTFCFVAKVDAAECSYEKQVELNNLAATVKATYEEVEIDTGQTMDYYDPETGLTDTNKQVPITIKGFEIKILNISKDLYLEITSDLNDESKLITYKDTDNGVYKYGRIDASYVHTFKISIGTVVDGCSPTALRIINLNTPRFNEFSTYSICDQYPEYENCSQYTTGNEISVSEFFSGIDKYKETKEKSETPAKEESFFENLKKIYKENKIIIFIIVGIILILGVTTCVVIIIRKRSRLI